MKLTFFLIAFFLVLLRVYLSWAGYARHNSRNDGNIVIKGDDFIEEMHWSGKVRLSDDEKSIADITPGGYLKFRENEQTFKAESNLQGEISYTLYDGHNYLASLDDSGRRFVAGVLQKMIARGWYSDGRAQRIAQKGGNQALLTEISHMEIDGAADQYVDMLFQSDSLTETEQIALLKQIGHMENSKKEEYLTRFTRTQLKDSSVGSYWLATVKEIWPDDNKKDLLMRYVGQVADSSGLAGNRFDSVVAAANHIGSDGEREDLYHLLIDSVKKTDAEWISLIRAGAAMENDGDKSDMLVRIAKKMPVDDSVKAEYKTAARTIKDDAEYGKAMRAIE
jgi:hypothetical protein